MIVNANPVLGINQGNQRTGPHMLGGTVEVNDVLTANRVVVVLDRRNMSYVASCLTNTDGSWLIQHLPDALQAVEMQVVALSAQSTANSAIADFITPGI